MANIANLKIVLHLNKDFPKLKKLSCFTRLASFINFTSFTNFISLTGSTRLYRFTTFTKFTCLISFSFIITTSFTHQSIPTSLDVLFSKNDLKAVIPISDLSIFQYTP